MKTINTLLAAALLAATSAGFAMDGHLERHGFNESIATDFLVANGTVVKNVPSQRGRGWDNYQLDRLEQLKGEGPYLNRGISPAAHDPELYRGG